MTENQKLREALQRLYFAAPTSLECKDFHHSKREQHKPDHECGPAIEYLAALKQANEALALPTASPVDELVLLEIDYKALIEAAFAKNKKWAQGTNGCIAFARGAEWFREQVARASLQSGADAVLAEREACAKVCEAERLTDNTNDPTDNAYNLAVEHCAMAIRTRAAIARGKGE